MTVFKVGDKVAWTHIGTGRRVMSMTLREGTVVAISDEGVAEIQPPSKRSKRAFVPVRRLRLDGEPSQIQEFVEGVRDAHRKAEDK